MPILARAGAAAAKGFGMLGKIAVAVDEYFEYVTLLLHGNGTNGAQNNTFLDSSTNNFTITRNGNTTQGTFSPYGSNWSNYFDGTSDYLGVPDSTAFDFGSGNFTIECWAFTETFASAYNVLVCQWNSSNAWIFRITSGAIGLYANIGGTQDYTASVTNSVGTWDHFAVVRNGTTLTFFKNGTSVGTATISGTIADSSNQVTVGILGDGNNVTAHKGYISNLRIVKGTAVYTGAFTPSTSPLTAITNTSLLTCQSNRFIDNSSNAFTITRNGDVSVQRFSPFNPTTPYAAGTIGGSGYFDGTGDYLDGSSSTGATNFGTGDFTVECWVYFISVAAQSNFIDNIGNNAVSLYTAAGGSLRFWNGSSNAITGATLTAGQWYHIALVRSSGTTRLYVNGTQSGSNYTDSTNYAGASTYPRIGAAFNATTFHNGYIADVRCVKSAVYTTTFTPPTLPLTAISNTSLLLSTTNGGIIDNAMMNNLETVGNAQISTSVSKFGGGSMAFDGTGDWLVMPPSPNFALGTGDFTIEGWAYITSFGSVNARGVFQQGTSSFPASVSNTVALGVNPSGTWVIFAKNTNTNSTATLSTGTWAHFALVRSGTTTTLYANGTSVITVTSDSTNYTGTYFGIGSIFGTSDTNWHGYIDDLRITKGYARYTANFTAPTAPFPLQ